VRVELHPPGRSPTTLRRFDDDAMRLVCPTCLGVGHIPIEQHAEGVYAERIGRMVVYPLCTTCNGLSWLYEV
jgi:hypothetical protein